MKDRIKLAYLRWTWANTLVTVGLTLAVIGGFMVSAPMGMLTLGAITAVGGAERLR